MPIENMSPREDAPDSNYEGDPGPRPDRKNELEAKRIGGLRLTPAEETELERLRAESEMPWKKDGSQ
ncbi:MAG: hypothetical protein A3B31_02270 [Candidatus Komeilibacteria bacterium RIFCSPLOWO2_01_FULL_53_11]|uniref:Uncharacterized protein n=1 Tax=Candidatus Komeilibacteria bacterium RIFCSPLOWO2_01_FULL_53_11 TaxID=1798552 RepID=A0A1G2BTZ3_9BACT|nr:MAG: hypothetical protein A3B31_02270 [Candidatus Komeilibacteria bacterium RIFCSPLOWO2_01_FULL_53_11]